MKFNIDIKESGFRAVCVATTSHVISLMNSFNHDGGMNIDEKYGIGTFIKKGYDYFETQDYIYETPKVYDIDFALNQIKRHNFLNITEEYIKRRKNQCRKNKLKIILEV